MVNKPGLVKKPHCSLCDGCSDTVRQVAYCVETGVTVCNIEAVKEAISQNICFCFVLCSAGCTVPVYCLFLLFCLPFIALIKVGDNHENYGRRQSRHRSKICLCLLIALERIFTHLQCSLVNLYFLHFSSLNRQCWVAKI